MSTRTKGRAVGPRVAYPSYPRQAVAVEPRVAGRIAAPDLSLFGRAQAAAMRFRAMRERQRAAGAVWKDQVAIVAEALAPEAELVS